MTRTLPVLLALVATVFPLGATAQSSDASSPRWESTRSGTAGTAEEEVFLGAFETIADYHLSTFSDSALWDRALDGLLSAIDDPYATVFSPEEYSQFEEQTTGNYAGIGVTITQLSDAVTITGVFRGTPADRVGLQVGDVIVGVDGDNATEWTVRDASNRIRGEVGTTVEVSVAREGYTNPIPHAIKRDNVHVSAVRSGMLPGNVGYVAIDRVARNSAREVGQAMQSMATADGVVIDLRRNPGGYLDESLFMADLFLAPGQKLASTQSRDPRQGGQREESWDARTPPLLPDVPIIILVDRYTASAAEIVTGALQDHDRALVLGERTFGKGVVQTLMPLPRGYQIRLTTGSWHTPLGRSLHRPRDGSGRPATEDLDTIPAVTTKSGRDLLAGGGIFPDLEVENDTLRIVERELVAAAQNAEVPLGLRIEEFAFARAQEARNGQASSEITPEDFQGFVDALLDEGLPPEALEDPTALAYLGWQTRISLAERLEDFVLATEHRMERDRVLTEAVRLLTVTDTQTDLFQLALEDGKGP
jgi:carboxyl-terminal processing protease